MNTTSPMLRSTSCSRRQHVLTQGVEWLLVVCVILNTAAATVSAAGAHAADDTANSNRDPFGIRMLYPTRQGTRQWTSAHWAKGTYAIAARFDPHDPQGISGKRGSGTLSVADGTKLFHHPAHRELVAV